MVRAKNSMFNLKSTSRGQKGTFIENSTKTKRAIEVYVFKRMLFLRGSSLKGGFIVEDGLQS